VLNWEPQMGMREGLTRLMAWLEQDRAKNG
jgi:hypothetical protein